MTNPANGPDLSAWYAEVQTRFEALRTALTAAPCMFLPCEIIEAIEAMDHATVQIEGELHTMAARLLRWNEAVEA